jgi:hypothetical protein
MLVVVAVGIVGNALPERATFFPTGFYEPPSPLRVDEFFF